MNNSRRLATAALLIALVVSYGAAPVIAGTGHEAAAVPRAAASQQDPETAVLAELRQTGVAREDFALKGRIDFFPGPGLRSSVILVFEFGTETLAYEAPTEPAGEPPVATPTAEVASLRAFGVLTPEGYPEVVVHEFAAPFTVTRGEGDGMFGATRSLGITVPPGEYVLNWGVVDVATGMAAARQQAVTVPDFNAGGLALTSVLACTGYEPRPDPFEPDRVYEGVRMANLVFRDDIDRVFPRSGAIELVYAVLGAQPDATTQRYEIEISYRILDPTGEQGIARFPSQVLGNPSVGQQLPLGSIEGLEPGSEYVLEIAVRDLVSGSELTETLAFRLSGGAGDRSDA